MNKMSRQSFLGLFPEPEPSTVDVNAVSKATQKNHKHKHNASAKPSAGGVVPSVYRRTHKGKKHAKHNH